MSKTVSEFLNQLPDFYKEKALKNMDLSGTSHVICDDLCDALLTGFWWQGSPEGHYFWEDLYELIENEYIYINN